VLKVTGPGRENEIGGNARVGGIASRAVGAEKQRLGGQTGRWDFFGGGGIGGKETDRKSGSKVLQGGLGGEFVESLE